VLTDRGRAVLGALLERGGIKILCRRGGREWYQGGSNPPPAA
jgi:hypothetical protein